MKILKILKKSIALAAVVAVSAVTLAGCADKVPDKFKVGYIRVMDDAQVIAAHEGGFYKKQGLDVELVEFKSGTDLIKAIIAGQVDTGVLGFTNAVAWASKGADLKVIGGAQHGYHAILAREETGIRDVAGLKGHTLASQAEGSTADTVLKGVVLKNAGLKPDDVIVMGVSPQVAVQSLVGKRVDAAFLFEPQATIAQLTAPVRKIYEIGEVWPFPCMVVITSGDTLKKRKAEVWKSLDAQKEAIDLLTQKPEEASRLIASYFVAEPAIDTLNKGKVSREDVVRDAIRSQTFSAVLTDREQARMQEIAGIMQEQGALKPADGRTFKVSGIVDISWQEERGLKGHDVH